MPTICEGFDGLTDFSLPDVLRCSPSMRKSYSRPNSERTFARADSMACRFAGTEKSVYGSFRKSAIGFTRLEADMFSLGLLDAREGRFAVVSETTDPFLARGPAQPASLRVDALERVQIEGGHP